MSWFVTSFYLHPDLPNIFNILLPKRHVLVKRQLWKHQNNVWNLLKHWNSLQLLSTLLEKHFKLVGLDIITNSKLWRWESLIVFIVTSVCIRAEASKVNQTENVVMTCFLTIFKISKVFNNKIVYSSFLYHKNKSRAEISSRKFLQSLPKPINSDTIELLKPLAPTKTENSQCKINIRTCNVNSFPQTTRF